MSYSHNLTIRVPLALEAVARKISQALDPDVGGADSWGVDGDLLVAHTPCQEPFYQQAQMLMANPAMLHHEVAADFATRWVGQEPPTLEDCQAFCAGIVQPEETQP